jgi:hypothetical protein
MKSDLSGWQPCDEEEKYAVFSRQTMSESEQCCPCSTAAECSREKRDAMT